MTVHRLMSRNGPVTLALVLLVSLVLLAACTAGPVSPAPVTPTALSESSADSLGSDEITAVPATSAALTPRPVGAFDCLAVSQIPATECAALVSLYEGTNGPAWVDSNGWLTTNTPCSWAGVTCTRDHVSHISLANNQLAGFLLPALDNLPFLQAVELGGNQLLGPIPAELGNLTELITLNLRGNVLTGPLPAELGNLRKLRSLSLADNQLSGSIPPTLGDAVSLDRLDLSRNQLGGAIPPELGNLHELYALSLSHNQLAGTIPVALGSLSKLDELDLSYNQLTGPVPAFVADVDQIMLWGNQLEGTIISSGLAPFAVDSLGVSFSADPTLATSIWSEARPASPLPDAPDGPSYWLALPEHVRITFADQHMSPVRRRMGSNVAAEAQILIFPLNRLADMNPLVQTQIEALRNLLAERGTVPAGELPLLPLANSVQVLHAQARYLDTGYLQGLRFISQHSQDPHPIMLSHELFYTFQGLSKDGAYYVAAFFPLTTTALPDTIAITDWEAFHAGYDTYLLETAALLDQVPPTGFSPNLTLLDSVLTSLRVAPPVTGTGIPGG